MVFSGRSSSFFVRVVTTCDWCDYVLCRRGGYYANRRTVMIPHQNVAKRYFLTFLASIAFPQVRGNHLFSTATSRLCGFLLTELQSTFEQHTDLFANL